MEEIITKRNHYRVIFETHDTPDIEEIYKCENILLELENHGIDARLDEPERSWYQSGKEEIMIIEDGYCFPLSGLSSIVKGLRFFSKKRIYVPSEERELSKKIIKEITGK